MKKILLLLIASLAIVSCIEDKLAHKYEIIHHGNKVDTIMTSKYTYMVIPKDNLTGSDIAAIREWFANNPTEVVYELKTPITYQLTSQ
jgi:hypothetical protein